MNKTVKYIALILLVAIAGGIIWWQYNKKRIVKNKIENAIVQGTDSTYYIKYDSSRIDALAGSATFFNIVLQSDSLQKELYMNDTSGLPKTIFNFRIESLAISGANIPSFLQKNTIEAKSIEIIRPYITIINTGKDEPIKFTAADTLALYEKIIGKFSRIEAKEVKVTDATIAFAKGKKSAHTTLQGVNILLQNLKIDSTKNYDNIISYFVNDIVATVKTAHVKNEKANRLLLFEGVEYNAAKKFLAVNKILQSTIVGNKNLITLNNNKITGLSTAAFIKNKQINADSLITDGGAIGIYRKAKNKAGGKETVEIDNEFFNVASVKNIKLGNTTLTIYNRANANEKPLVLKNVKFKAANIDSVSSGTDVLKLLGKSQWDFAADGISFVSDDKVYNITIGPFQINKNTKQVLVDHISIIPTMSEAAFVKSLKFQKDLYNVNLKNIMLEGTNIKTLMENNSIIAEKLSFQPTIKVYNDKLVTPDTESKLGKYPHQLLAKLATAIYIKTVNVNNGYVSYRERGALSKNVGDVFFTNVNGVVSNVTNIPNYLKQNNVMLVNVTSKFLNTATLNSQWKLPLNTPNGVFTITGKVGSFDGVKLNPVIEPLGMGSVKSGNINGYTFNIQGTDYKATGDGILLYDNLKIKLLKSKDDAIKNKNVTSFVANVLIKDQNPSNGKTRSANIYYDRVMTKSFFNLVWKSIFDGAKKSLR